MNFFGHALIAAELGGHAVDPRRVLGAMLPDFASMARTRLGEAADVEVAAGVALHHETDAVFHRLPHFLALSEEGVGDLERAGVGRGPARATSHVGAELLLDGLLLERGGTAPEAYLAAVGLDWAPLSILGRDEDGTERLGALYDRLGTFGLPDDYRTVDGCLLRLTQTLARRPRLAIGQDEQLAVREWLVGARAQLALDLDELMETLLVGLRARTEETSVG